MTWTHYNDVIMSEMASQFTSLTTVIQPFIQGVDRRKYQSTASLAFVRKMFPFKWKFFPRYWTFVRGIHRSPVNSPRKGQWRGALMFSLICAWINGWVNNREAGDLRRHHAYYDVFVMLRQQGPVCVAKFLLTKYIFDRDLSIYCVENHKLYIYGIST